MQWWLRNSGSVQQPYTRDDWRSTHGDLWDTVNFPKSKKPSARAGDRMLWHAVGSAEMFGNEGRIFALGVVTSDAPFWDERPERARWPWALEVDILVTVPLLSLGIKLSDIGKEGRSLRRQQYVRLTEEQGERGERLLRAAAAGV